MQDLGWIINASFLAGGAFTFLRLTASARRGAVATKLAEKLAKEAKKHPRAPKQRAKSDVVLTRDPN
ncbi:MAG: hypothetical protein DCC65_04025 [Planctomycetota bacterium]|nr:MAG: hypothetical protein DCC65_04025 [Planctomycetota bacterium]